MEPDFPAYRETQANVSKEFRKIPVPPHRMTPLREHWEDIVGPIVEHMKLQIKMNIKLKRVELRTCRLTDDPSALQRASQFIKAFMCGFEVQDAIAMLRLEDIDLESFEIKGRQNFARGEPLKVHRKTRWGERKNQKCD